MAIGASSTGGITLGAGNASTTIAGGLTVSGQIYANAGLTVPSGLSLTVNGVINSTDYSSTSASTNMEFGKSSTSGAIYIGHNQTGAALNIGCGTGAIRSTNADINIGTNGSALSIGNVNIGYPGSSTIAPPTSVQLNGIVKLTGSLVTGVPSGTTGILSGRVGYGSGGAVTITAAVLNSTYTYIISSVTTVTVTLPATATDYQIISKRSMTNVTHTITAGGVTNIFPIGSINVLTYTLPVYGAVKYIFVTNTWYQIY
jgi:hypothetical protein